MNPLKELIVEVIYSVIPITLVILIILLLMKFPLADLTQFLLGTLFVFLGLLLFFLGTKIGVVPIGEMIGKYLPQTGKIGLILFLGFLLGFAITVAEPDVQILATQVDLVSGGAVPKIILICAVALGVAVFIALSLYKLIANIHIKYFLIASYALVLLLALVAPPDFVPIALDSGGVTTGPITVPFIVALGVGIAGVFSGKRNSFGFVGLASVGPILAVLLLGVIFGR
jgi:hypothetical protein